jgi:hypothetical protein
LAKDNHVWSVHLKPCNRSATNRSLAIENAFLCPGLYPLEVIGPGVYARVKQPSGLTRYRVGAVLVHPLGTITMRTSQSNIVENGRALATARHYMIDRKGSDLAARRKTTILTALIGTCDRRRANGIETTLMGWKPAGDKRPRWIARPAQPRASRCYAAG